MVSNLQVDVYVAPAAPIATGHPDPSKRWFSPISCTLIQGPTSAVLVDTPATIELSQGLASWIKKTAPEKKLLYIYTETTSSGTPLFSVISQRQNALPLPPLLMASGSNGLAVWRSGTSSFPRGRSLATSISPTLCLRTESFISTATCSKASTYRTRTQMLRHFFTFPTSNSSCAEYIVYGGCYQFLGEANTPEKKQMWLQSLDQIAALDPHIVVPGHKRASQIDGSYLIEATRAYILAFEEELEKAGNSEKLEEAMIRRYPHRWNRFLLEQSCQRTWSALSLED
ncbi:metallo-beta-lactamase domain-containing protein [Colletotrichum asianum]|uniref:Metallo-beta-lactamase domain-containing protein n=1 Tax=Colletotrichum asianum TaxID=702518 RepID=A0A8H3ZH14_9PEZI|nr:metallo-beta-lactamase domain-containing protein [Colletotrichum asianum]